MITVTFDGGMKFVGRGESGHEVWMDASAKAGGADKAARPIEVLLSALGGCTGMDVISILRKMRTEPDALRIEIVGERAKGHPTHFTRIHLTYVVSGDVTKEKIEKAIELSLTKYCSVANTLAGVAEITSEVRFETVPSPADPQIEREAS